MHIRPLTIVTGGGRGIGRAIALRMAQETPVLIVGRTEADLAAVCRTIKEAGGEAEYIVGDVADENTAARTLARAQELGCVVRNLVCNAGIGKGGPITSFTTEVWRTMFDVNVHGAFNFIRTFLPSMIEEKQGSVSMISSTLGLKGRGFDAAYSATKFALVGMAQSLSAEVKKHGITVVALCPGFVETDMTAKSIANLAGRKQVSIEEARRILAATNPQGRILKTEELAEAVAYIAYGARPGEGDGVMDLTGASEPRLLHLINWIRRAAAPARKLVIPISGGSDSALVFYLLNRACPGRVIGVYAGTPRTLRCRAWFESVGEIIYLPPTRRSGDKEIWRWAQFLQLSHDVDGWLVGARNRTEEITGFYSLASRVATFLPLSGIWKSQVMELCQAAGVPAEVMVSSRCADPDCGRPQSLAEIPLELIDTYARVQSGELSQEALNQLTADQRSYLVSLVTNNEFRRHLPTRGPVLIA